MQCHTWYPSNPWQQPFLLKTRASYRLFPHKTLPCCLWGSSLSVQAGWKCTRTSEWSSCPASWSSHWTRLRSLRHLHLRHQERRRTRGGRCHFGWQGRGRTSSSSISVEVTRKIIQRYCSYNWEKRFSTFHLAGYLQWQRGKLQSTLW